MEIKDIISEIRITNSLSQAEFGEKIGVWQRTISRWERGEKTPAYENLKKICEVFDVPPDYVLGLSDYGSDSLKPSKVHKDAEITPTTQIARSADAVTPEEQILLNKLRKIPPALQDQAFDYLDAFLETTIKRYRLSDPGDQEA